MTELVIYISWLDRQILEVTCGIRIESENKGNTVNVIWDHTNVVTNSIINNVTFIKRMTAHLCMTGFMRTYDIKTAMASHINLNWQMIDQLIHVVLTNQKAVNRQVDRQQFYVLYCLSVICFLLLYGSFLAYICTHAWFIDKPVISKAHPICSVSRNGTSDATWTVKSLTSEM